MAFLKNVVNSIELLAKSLAKVHRLSIVVYDKNHRKMIQAGAEDPFVDTASLLWQQAKGRARNSFDVIINGFYISAVKIYSNDHSVLLIAIARTADSALSDEVQNEVLNGLARTVQSCLQWAEGQRAAVLELMEKYEELTLLYDISEKLECLPSFDEVADEMLREATARVRCKVGRLVLVEEGNHYERFSHHRHDSVPHDLLVYQGTQDIAASCLERSATKVINDNSNDHPLTQLHVPISLKETPIGILSLYRQLTMPFKASEKKIAEMLARQTAGKLESSRLYSRLETLFMDSIRMLVECIDARDSYTCGHSERVAVYSVFLAKELGLPEDQVKAIRIGALLHDVGKIRIRDNVLNKPGRLDDSEMSIIRKHPEFGLRIVEHVTQLVHSVPCIYYHHESYDGRGYPQRLGGEEIPLMGRIVTIADTFDAMTSTRPYRQALSQKQAYDELIRLRGIQFDPHLAEVFAEAILRGEFTKYVENQDGSGLMARSF
jgi:putative nucleotidyltransferase with HDIG domain